MRPVRSGLLWIVAIALMLIGTSVAMAESAPPAVLVGHKPVDLRLVDLNTATAVELEALPGIGVKKAQAIIAFREKRPFRRPTELMRIKGIGPKLYLRLKDRVRAG
ncbi:MAG: helix-hairpin-helix domain-containing protein [Deltaproteobacteria bacterium]|nr:helix-hairpin-helix domain-containing protein [Deltaproteobacteria bacterium]